MNIKYTATVKPEKRNALDGSLISENVPLMIDLTYDGNRMWLSTGYRIDVSKWDSISRKAKANTTHSKGVTAKTINEGVALRLNDIAAAFKNFEVKGIMPSKEDVRFVLTKKTIKKEQDSFFSLFDQFVADRSKTNEWKSATITKYKTIKKSLSEFDPKLTIEKANQPDTLQQFIDFLRTEKELRNTTIAKHLRFVKGFLKWAYDSDKCLSRDYQKFTPNLKGTDGRNKTVIFLTRSELMHLYNFTPEKDYLTRVKDVFCFCCVTGMRYSDAYKLKKSDIKKDHIQYTTQKTDHAIKVELNDISSAILAKYRNTPFASDKALPVISNQKMNGYLKELCKLAGFDELMTTSYYKGGQRVEETSPKYALIGTHTARRTFICLGLYLGIAAETIMQWTGHSSHETMKPYIGVISELKEKEMKKFNFLEG